MAKGFDSLHVKSAVKSRNKFDLSRTHLTTMDFGEIVPLLSQELVPGDKFSIKGNYFSRMAPLVKPTYGKFTFRTMSVFVPYFQVADDVEAWLAGDTYWQGTTTHSRVIAITDLVSFFENCATEIDQSDLIADGLLPSGSYSMSANAGKITFTDQNDATLTYTFDYDWSVTNSSGTKTYYKFEDAGKYFLKVMNALGYALPQNVDWRTSSSWYSAFNGKEVSALPLLCFAKAYNDWMSQSQRFNTSNLTYYLRQIKEDKNVSNIYYSGTHRVLPSGIRSLLNEIKVQYENDYFTSAWQKPNSPLNNIGSITSIKAAYSDGAGYDTTISNTQNSTDVVINYNKLTQRALDYLKSFDDWVRRNNYSGSRAVQKVYSRFGIKTDDYRSNYAHVITTDVVPVNVGDVTAQAQSTDVPLGDYAGKGIMNGSKGFSFDSSDYGMLFILGWYTVTPMMAYGFDRTVLKTDPLDYYNPEFDGIGANAISYGEVFANPIPTTTDSTLDNAVYGFTERYNEYRFGRDQITGDFRNYHTDADMNTWHTGRLLNEVRRQSQMIAQSTSMNSLPQYGSEYNRIFSITDDSVDHFYMTAQFDVSAIRPMLSLNQVPRLGEGDTNVPRNGNTIN